MTLYIKTPKIRKKISTAMLGHIVSTKIKNKIGKSCSENAKINPNYGMRNKHHSEKTKRRLKRLQKMT